MSGFDFVNVKWDIERYRLWKVGFPARAVVYDERNLRVDPDRIEHVVKLYRQLTINYEQAKSYQLAGEFHYSAMEVQRTFLGVPRKTLNGFWLSLGSRIWRWLRRNIFSLLAWYHHLCGYGERPVQVILV